MDFDTLIPYTMTTVISTNLKINLNWLYEILTVLEVDSTQIVGKKQKERFKEYIMRTDPPLGSITMVQYKQFVKGWKFKKGTVIFRNGMSLVMYVGKLVTVKIPECGCIQLTGCVTNEHSEIFIKQLRTILSAYPQSPETYVTVGNINNSLELDFSKETTPIPLMASIQVVMTDIVFNIGFFINLQLLDQYMHYNTVFNSLFETSFGYTGVNIKLPFQLELDKPCVKHLVITDNQVDTHLITYNQHFSTLKQKDQKKMLTKERRNTFLVFHSGSVIMSGMTLDCMKPIFNQFIKQLYIARPQVEEHIVT
jgi:hypothetical protein